MVPAWLAPVLAIWGAVLSTVLASIKLWEVWRDRSRLTTSYSFSNSAEHGNEIIVENPSATPVLVTYWELIWVGRRFGRGRIERTEANPDEGYSNITIAAHSRERFLFRDRDWFKAIDQIEGCPARLYLKLYIAGRKAPLWLLAWRSA